MNMNSNIQCRAVSYWWCHRGPNNFLLHNLPSSFIFKVKFTKKRFRWLGSNDLTNRTKTETWLCQETIPWAADYLFPHRTIKLTWPCDGNFKILHNMWPGDVTDEYMQDIYVYIQDHYADMQDMCVYMRGDYVYVQDNYVYIITWYCFPHTFFSWNWRTSVVFPGPPYSMQLFWITQWTSDKNDPIQTNLQCIED